MTYPWKHLAKGVGLLVIGLGLLEGGLHLRLFRRFLPLPSPYYNEEILLRQTQLHEFIAKSGEPEIVVIGSSIARSNIDATRLSEVTGKRVFGLGFSAFPHEALALTWEKIWAKEFKQPPTLVVVFNEHDLLHAPVDLKDSVLMRGRVERGWIDPAQMSPIDKVGLSNLELAKYYGSLSKALSIARGPFLGSPFSTDSLGSRPYNVPFSGARYDQILRTVPKLTNAEVQKGKANFFASVKSLARVHSGKIVVLLSPSYLVGWSAGQERTEVYKQLKRDFSSQGQEAILTDNESFSGDRRNYSDTFHYMKQGALEFSRLAGEAINTQISSKAR